MKKERFFPEDHRSFCNGPLAANIDRFGGIESLHLLNIQEFNNKLFPARRPWKLFSRDGKSLNRPYIYPALRFFHENPDGAVRAFFPENPDIYPAAVLSSSYNFSLRHDGFTLEVNSSSTEKIKFICAITKASYFDQQFEQMSNYNQLAHEDIWLPPELHGNDFDTSEPFADGRIDLLRDEPFFDTKSNALIFKIHAAASFFEKDIIMAITAEEKLIFTQDLNQWMLKSDFCCKNKMIFSLGIAENITDAVSIAKQNINLHASNLASHIAPDRFPLAPAIKISNMPEAAQFIEVLPYFQKSLSLAETENGIAIRAAANKFGFFAFWDHIYPLRDFLLCGETETARKGLIYMLDYPHWDTNSFVFIHLAIALNEYLAFCDDTELLMLFMEPLKKAFDFTLSLADEKTGLIRYGLDTAVDIMPELGLDGLFRASCINGWWYDCCCCLVNFAIRTNDHEFAARAAAVERKLSENYTRTFFDAASGFLKAAVGENFEEMNCNVFLQTKTIAADYIHGSWLFRKIRRPMADYINKHLHHPMGLSAVAYDSEAPAIYLKGTRMNQHLGHSCKLLRSAGDTGMVNHQLGNYLYTFKQTLNAVETFNYSYCPGDQTQRADWQAFSASAAAQAIIQGKIGMAWHQGGLFFVPADDNSECTVDNFNFRRRKYQIKVSGSGAFAEIILNGKKISNSMQFPTDLLQQENSVEIKRNSNSPQHPVLMWIIDTPVYKLEHNDKSLQFCAGATVFAKMECFVPGNAVMTINDQKAAAEYDSNSHRLWFSGIINKDDIIKITLL